MTKEQDLSIVRATLTHYAMRGAFGSFSETRAAGRKVEFQFRWFRDVKFKILYDPDTRVLMFVDLLPDVSLGSRMDRAFRRFIASRTDESIPEHRRVDCKRVGVVVRNRHGSLSLVCALAAEHIEYGTKKAVHLVHDVLMDFLNDSLYVEYAIAHFNLNPEMA